MAEDDDLLASLESLVAADPDQSAVRVHLAGLYLVAGRPAEALGHAEAVLTRQPANVAALQAAADAADALGQGERAVGWRTLLAALGPVAPQSDRPPTRDVAPVPVGAGEGDNPSLDAFLDEVLGRNPDLVAPSVTLADVGGLVDVKKRLQTSFLAPMRNPELRRMYGKSLRGGLLLYGPPGCGKTFLARAVAGELGARFYGVGLHDILDMWMGKSEQNLHQVFETARRNTPCVVFLDEVDALGQKRSNLSRSAGRNVVVQLLSELDNSRDDNEGVFVLGATNQPWDLDPALRRPGRFDRMLLVLPPDRPARAAILALHLARRPVAPDIDIDRIAAHTDGFSGADLRLLCESAAETALEASIGSGEARPIDRRDLDAALKEARPSTRPWFDTAKHHAMFANEGGVYDELLGFMRKSRML